MIMEMVALVLAMLTTVTIGVLAGMLAGQTVVWVINHRRAARLGKLDAWMAGTPRLAVAVVSPPPPGPALMAVAEKFDVNPEPLYRVFEGDNLVVYGDGMVHQRCSDARRAFATDHVCQDCAVVYGRVHLAGGRGAGERELAEAPLVVLELQPCGKTWRGPYVCLGPSPHTCALIGGHRIHRCVCGDHDEDVPL